MNEGDQNLDETFLNILLELQAQAIRNAEQSVHNVLEVSSEFISKSAYKDLMEFYKLYFHGGKEIEEKSNEINKGVDKIIEQAQTLSDEGIDASEIASNIIEDQNKALERTNLAFLQKKMESLISLEEGLKDRLTPILSAMKFEDHTKKRTATIGLGFRMIIKILADSYHERLPSIVDEMKSKLSFKEERDLFYNVILEEVPSQEFKENSIWDNL